MYTENRRRDLLLFARAVLTNQLALLGAPLYIALSHGSGRGSHAESAEQTAGYFRGCVDDYFAQLGLARAEARAYLDGKRVLEYGPGDTVGVALLLLAHGAESVDCVDRFHLHIGSEKSVRVYEALLRSLEGEEQERANRAFRVPGDPRSGFDPKRLGYRATPHGMSGARSEYDLVISRAVLALVDRLDQTLEDVAAALKPGGTSVHKVDLSSHGLDRYRPLDFLTWPDLAYQMMYSRKGRPNRWRVDKYKEWAASAGLRIRKLEPTGQVSREDTLFMRPKMARQFRELPPDELSWLGFWMILERA